MQRIKMDFGSFQQRNSFSGVYQELLWNKEETGDPVPGSGKVQRRVGDEESERRQNSAYLSPWLWFC